MGKKILVVEDEWIVAAQILQDLEKFGYNVLPYASTGAEAYKAAAREKPDLVLMDIMLNGKDDGIAAAARITKTLNLPVVFITAYADADFIKKAKKTMPYGYMVKPFGEIELRSTIEIAINKHEADRELWICHDKLKKDLKKTIDIIAKME